VKAELLAGMDTLLEALVVSAAQGSHTELVVEHISDNMISVKGDSPVEYIVIAVPSTYHPNTVIG
jgi:hypothetical protein